MNFFGRQPTPPAVPRAPRTLSNSSAVRPGSHRSTGSGGRISTSSQSTPEPEPEPDADIGEDFAVCCGDDAALDYGWGDVKESKMGAELTAAENRIRALEKMLQTERRLRKDAEDSLKQARVKLSTQGEMRDVEPSGTDDDLLMDVGVQTDKQPEPTREAVEREIDAAVTKLQARNDTLEIENQMLQNDLERKDTEIATLRSDNKVLWAEQDAVRAAKDDFKDLQQQLASHIKAGNLITKRPTSNANRVYAGAQDCTNQQHDVCESIQKTPYGTEDSPSQSPEHESKRGARRPEGTAQLATQEPGSALSNFMGIFQGDIRGDSDDEKESVLDSNLAFDDDALQTVAGKDESSNSRVGAADHVTRLSPDLVPAMTYGRPLRSSTGRIVAGENPKPSVAEYRRSVGDYRNGIAALEAKLRPATAEQTSRARTHNVLHASSS